MRVASALLTDTAQRASRLLGAATCGGSATISEGLMASCPVAALEMLAAARDEAEFSTLDRVFAALPQAPVTPRVCGAALGAARELGGSRRLPAADYLIAAVAAERGFGVLHLNAHYDTLATVLGFSGIRLDRD